MQRWSGLLSLAQSRVSQPAHCSRLGSACHQSATKGAAWDSGVTLTVETCWKTAVSSSVLRSQAEGMGEQSSRNE